MIIRQEQLEVLERASVKEFEDRTHLHLQQWFPHQCQLLGEDLIRRAIRHGLQKASGYGLTAECCVRSYIESMLILGGEFDTDVPLPWAAEILSDRSSSDQVARGDRLYHGMWNYLDLVARDYRDLAGQPITSRFMNDLRELRHGADESITPESRSTFTSLTEMRLRRLFPAKCSYLEDAGLRKAVVMGTESAAAYGITSVRGVTLFTSMRFVLGGNFHRDLLLPWASATLNDAQIPDQHTRVDKLYAEGVKFLRRWWEISSQPGGLDYVLG
jgi:hypothetical protein